MVDEEAMLERLITAIENLAKNVEWIKETVENAIYENDEENEYD